MKRKAVRSRLVLLQLEINVESSAVCIAAL